MNLPRACAVACLLVVGCTTRGGGNIIDNIVPRDAAADGVAMDGQLPDGSPPPPDGSVVLDAPPDVPPVNACNPSCGPTELCGGSDGNGLDDDCDGMVDEDCPCSAVNVTRPCFAGPPDRRNVGACTDGVMTCSEFLQWSGCNSIGPTPERCDGVDNDCNAITDDVTDCTSAITCPSNQHAPPLSNFLLDGNLLYTGAGSEWNWQVECPDSVPDALCPRPAAPGSKSTSVYFTASGAYRVTASLKLDDGAPASCAWTVYVQGTGLRVELNWDTMLDTAGGVDMDLHLHRWTRNGVDTPWFGGDPFSGEGENDDCFYANCQPDDDIDWPGHPPSDLSVCETAPHGGGATWRRVGSCRNPRLDVDTNGTDGACRASVTDPNSDAFCAPENINVDEPILGMPYRVMVNYYGGEPRTNAQVAIYCGGSIRAVFGGDPIVVLDHEEPFGIGAANDNWLVADVVFFEGTCGIDCRVYPLGGIVRASGGGFGGLPFGPPWSCDYDPASATCTAP